jgi:ankyrin repeat protein
MVEMLLRLGADPNAKDDGSHTRFTGSLTGCLFEGSGIVEALVKAGSEVNARQGVTLCTPLHMAARRGNVEVAQTLLKCGADPSIRDRRGATALDRAKSCRQHGVLSVLSAFA